MQARHGARIAAGVLMALAQPGQVQPGLARPADMADSETAGEGGESPADRIARVARRLLVANAAQCSRQRWDYGLAAHRDRLLGALGPAAAPVDASRTDGFRVAQLMPSGPAARAGVRLDDHVLAANGQDWTTPGFLAAFARAEWGQPVADRIELRLARAGSVFTVQLRGDRACAIPVRLVQEVKPNARASLGMAFVNSGLEEALPQDDQLASVIAHEIAHVILGHSKADADSNARAQMERDADALGVRLSLRAGFDPQAAARAVEVIGARLRGQAVRAPGLYGDYMPTPMRKSFLLEQAIEARQEQMERQAAAAEPGESGKSAAGQP